ncbi:ribonuclease H-like domain, reverse transcriptase, RNA-dependent DNA polymerase [Tanacetum coccineum]
MMKKHMEIVPDDEVAIDAIPLATKPPIIIDWKIIKEGKMGYFQIIRVDGSSRRYSSMIKMLQNIDREDMETLWKLVKAKHGNTRPGGRNMKECLWGMRMTKSSSKKLITPYENPKQKFLSSRKLIRTRSLDCLDSPESNLFSNYVDQFKEEVILFYKGLDVPTRQILDFKGAIPSMNVVDAKKVIREMANRSQKWHNITSTRTRSTDTSDELAAIQAQLNNLGRKIKKVNEKVYAAQVGCKSCKGPHYTKDCPLKKEVKAFEEAFYTQYGVPFLQGGRFRAAALGFYQRDNNNPSYQERRQTMEESMNKFMAESAKRHDRNSMLIKEIRPSTDAAIRN